MIGLLDSDDSFDLAFNCDTYHHFEFPYKTIRFFGRVGKQTVVETGPHDGTTRFRALTVDHPSSSGRHPYRRPGVR